MNAYVTKLLEFLAGGKPDKPSLALAMFAPLDEQNHTILDLLPVHRIKEITFIWNPSMLKKTNERGETILHIAARKGFLDQCPHELTEGMLTATSNYRGQRHKTVIEYAAQYGNLHQIPEAILKREIAKDIMYERNILTLAALNKHINQIPRTCLTEQTLLREDAGENCFQSAASGGSLDQIPTKFLTAHNLTTITRSGSNALHRAARHGNLYQVPQNVLTAENLGIFNHQEQTAVQIAAEYGFLNQIPLQTIKDLMYVCIGNTDMPHEAGHPRGPEPGYETNLLHNAAFRGNLKVVPKELFSEKDMLYKTETGNNVLHIAAIYNCTDQIPKEYLTEKNLLLKNNMGATTLKLIGNLVEQPWIYDVEFSLKSRKYFNSTSWEKYKNVRKSKLDLVQRREETEIEMF